MVLKDGFGLEANVSGLLRSFPVDWFPQPLRPSSKSTTANCLMLLTLFLLLGGFSYVALFVPSILLWFLPFLTNCAWDFKPPFAAAAKILSFSRLFFTMPGMSSVLSVSSSIFFISRRCKLIVCLCFSMACISSRSARLILFARSLISSCTA